MLNSKPLKLAIMTLASVTIFHGTNALAEGALCSDWSYNDPNCSSYIKPTAKTADATPPVQIAENHAKQSSNGALCADWSYNDPNCPAYIKRSGN